MAAWHAFGRSVCGSSHEKVHQPGQDFCLWKILGSGILAAAIADGAGSASMGGRGAEQAAAAAMEYLEKSMTPGTLPSTGEEWQSLFLAAMQSAFSALEKEAMEQKVNLSDLATTLITVMATPERIAAAQIGDGAVVVGLPAALRALTMPQGGEYANETTFLTSSGALEHVQVAIDEGRATHLALFTDGLQRLALKMPEAVPHTPFFLPLMAFAAEVEDETQACEDLGWFLQSEQVRRRTDDDLTLILAVWA